VCVRGEEFQFVSHIPRQQFVDAGDLVISDVGQDVFQVGTRVDSVELARPDQAIHRGGPLAPAVGADEQIIFASMQICALTQ
jgi:hypothetical protein